MLTPLFSSPRAFLLDVTSGNDARSGRKLSGSILTEGRLERQFSVSDLR